MAKQIKLRPEQKVGESKDLNRHWVGLFLDTLAETSNVTASAAMAGCNPSRAYKLRRVDAAFRQKWADALLEGYEHLEMETLQRLRSGVEKDGNKADIPNALRLLAMHRESVARAKAQRDMLDEDSILESLNAKIDTMRAREAEAKRMLRDNGTITIDLNAAD